VVVRVHTAAPAVSVIRPRRRAEAQSLVVDAVRVFASGGGVRAVVVESVRGVPVGCGIRADAVLPGASLLKVPLVAAAYEAAERGDVDLGEVVTRVELAASDFPSVLAAFDPSHRFTLRELCALTLVTSDNAAAAYVLERVGAEGVARTARVLAGPRTRLAVGFADRDLGVAARGNVTTAREAATMMRTIMTEARFGEVAAALANNVFNIRIPLRLTHVRAPHKTGSLQGVVNDAGVLFGRETDVVAAFLCDKQADPARTSLEIGDCVATIWRAVGED
jgi:beta-lactamase class A